MSKKEIADMKSQGEKMPEHKIGEDSFREDKEERGTQGSQMRERRM